MQTRHGGRVAVHQVGAAIVPFRSRHKQDFLICARSWRSEANWLPVLAMRTQLADAGIEVRT